MICESVTEEGLFGRKVDALRGVTFQVPKGKIFGLLGPNGAGKTTIIKILLGIARPTGGSATLLGYPAGRRAGRRRVGYLPENLQMPRHQTARTALEYFGRLSGMDHGTIKSRGAVLLEKVGLANRQRRIRQTVFQGMRQRLGLAQALLHEPELLILDEPTDGLDPVGRSQVRDIMRELSDQGRTVFVNSHLLQEVELVCDEVAILNHGELKHIGGVEELASAADGSSIELELELLADTKAAQACLVGHQISAVDSKSAGRVGVTLAVRDQNEINQVIDALRKHDISIVALLRRRNRSKISSSMSSIRRARTA